MIESEWTVEALTLVHYIPEIILQDSSHGIGALHSCSCTHTWINSNTLLRPLSKITHLILITSLWGRYYYYSHLDGHGDVSPRSLFKKGLTSQPQWRVVCNVHQLQSCPVCGHALLLGSLCRGWVGKERPAPSACCGITLVDTIPPRHPHWVSFHTARLASLLELSLCPVYFLPLLFTGADL